MAPAGDVDDASVGTSSEDFGHKKVGQEEVGEVVCGELDLVSVFRE